MTDPSQDAPPPPERSRRRPDQDRGSTVSMTSTTTGLPDRYRPLDQVGPDEPTPTGVIRCWRAKDRVLNRDVAIRVHTPAGPAAHAWISRALTAGGLATPALAMVYDASEGTGDPQAPGGAAYVVNEWIDGETLAERLARGPLPEREVRTVLRRLAEGVAEAHRVGPGRRRPHPRQRRAAPQRPGRPAGRPRRHRHHRRRHRRPGRPARGLPDRPGARRRPSRARSPARPTCVALVRRARSTEPGQGLSSVAAMAALLAERPRSGPGAGRPRQRRTAPHARRPTAAGCAGCATAGRSAGRRRPATDGASRCRLDPQTLPPGPAGPPGRRTAAPAAPGRPRRRHDRRRHGRARGRRLRRAAVAAPPATADRSCDAAAGRAATTTLADGLGSGGYDDRRPATDRRRRRRGRRPAPPPRGHRPAAARPGRRRRAGLVDRLDPALVTGSVDDVEGSTPSASASAGGSARRGAAAAGRAGRRSPAPTSSTRGRRRARERPTTCRSPSTATPRPPGRR